MSAQTSMLHIPVDDHIREEAAQALEAVGLTVSDAVRLFLQRVATEQTFPLELKVPNASTRAAMEESRAMMAHASRFTSAQAMFDELEKPSQTGQ